MLSSRSSCNKVTPAPSAPGIARTANVDTSASNSGNPRLSATKPARSSIPARKTAASALACRALSDPNGKPSTSSVNSVIFALNYLGGAGNRHRSPASHPWRNRHEMVVRIDITPAGAEQKHTVASSLPRGKREPSNGCSAAVAAKSFIDRWLWRENAQGDHRDDRLSGGRRRTIRTILEGNEFGTCSR